MKYKEFYSVDEALALFLTKTQINEQSQTFLSVPFSLSPQIQRI